MCLTASQEAEYESLDNEELEKGDTRARLPGYPRCIGDIYTAGLQVMLPLLEGLYLLLKVNPALVLLRLHRVRSDQFDNWRQA